MDAETMDIRSSSELAELAAALASAQAEYPELKKERVATVKGKTKTGAQYDYQYKYADMSDVLAAVRPVLSKHKLCLVQPTFIRDGVIFLRSRVLHSSGQWIESDYPVASYADQPHQRLGEAMTYAKRYAGCALLGIHAEETVEGDDSAGTGRAAAVVDSGQPADKKNRGQQIHGPLGITALRNKMRDFSGDLERAGDLDELEVLLTAYKPITDQCMMDLQDWWFGVEGSEVLGAEARIDEKRKELRMKAADPANHNPLSAG